MPRFANVRFRVELANADLSKNGRKALWNQASGVTAKSWEAGQRLRFAEGGSQNVLVRLYLTKKTMAQSRPFFLSDLAFEHRLLNTLTEVFASLRDTPQTAPAVLFDGENIVGDEDEHGRRVEEEWRNKRIIWERTGCNRRHRLASPREETSLDKRQLRDAQVFDRAKDAPACPGCALDTP